MPGGSQEANVLRTYIETVLEMPWKKVSRDNQDIIHAKEILEEDHYGLEKVKDRVLEFLAVRALTKKGTSRSSALWDRPEQVRPPSRDRLPAPSERSMSGSALAAFTTRRRYADTERHTWERCRAVSPMQCVRQACQTR